MKSSFVSVLTAILSDQEKIDGFPDDKIFGENRDDCVAITDVPRDYAILNLVTKVARLNLLAQLLRSTTDEMGKASREVFDHIGGDLLSSLQNVVALYEDSLCDQIMLERLIVQVVREAIPAEYDQFEVTYTVGPNLVILRCPRPSRFFKEISS